MTDKQIIIDGIDVSGCEHYDEVCLGNHHYKWCKDNDNCYYKQLKRKEQECEADKMEAEEGYEINVELKAKNEILEKDKANLAVITETLKVQFKKLKQTLAEIKEIAESEMDSKEFMAVQYMLNGSIDNKNKVLKQILQKINEVEDEG